MSRWRIRVWVGLAIAFGIALGQLPPFGVLGFEFALVAAAFGAIMGLDVGAAYAREPERRARYTVATAIAIARALAILAIPAAICAIRGLWTPTCDWWFGLVALVAMPVISTALAAALGFAIGTLCGPRGFVGAIAAQLPVVLLVAWGLWRFYAAPPVFSYDPLVGFFPGNLYDENVALGAALWWSRLEELAWVVAICAVVSSTGGRVRLRPAPLALAALAVAGALVLRVNAGTLGYSIDATDIADALGGRIETAHFVIHYAHTKDIDADIALIAADHEFRYAQDVATLGVGIPPPGKIDSFYFADRDQKARWMGARDVEMAKPWRHEIYLDHRAFPHPSLRHEIAHVIASEFGDPIFGVAARRVAGLPLLISPGLVEGLAVATDWPGGYDRMTPHESVRVLQALGLTPSINDLLSLAFFSVSSARGYTTAGSFLKFLLDAHGAPALRALYASGGDFEGAYHEPLAQLQREWLAMLATITVPADEIEASRERFRAAGVFATPCVHAIAARREHAIEALAAGDRRRAIALMREVCADAPDEPTHQIELGDFLNAGSADELDHDEAEQRWTEVANDAAHVTPSVRVQAFERLARSAAHAGNLGVTGGIISRALTIPVDAGDRRQLEAEAFALAYTGPAGLPLRAYFYASASPLAPVAWAELATLAEPSLGFAFYLRGLQRAVVGDWTGATADLDHALDLGLPSALFVRNAARHLAVAAYRIHDVARVERAAAVLDQPSMLTVDRLLAADWRARLTFR